MLGEGTRFRLLFLLLLFFSRTADEAAEQLRRLIERCPDVKANCLDVKFPKGKFEKRVKRGGRREIGDRILPKGKSEERVKRGGRREIGDRISRPLDVWVGMRWERFAPT